MGKTPVSVVVIARNEEENIAKCLESLDWADEVIVVDDESTDKTPEIAKRYTDRVVIKKMEIEGKHRNYAYSLAKNDWVLSLDADEVVTSELADEIDTQFKQGQGIKYPTCTIPIRTYIGNHWIRYGGWYPASKVRLFRKSKVKYEEVEVHPRILVDGDRRSVHLKKDIIHYSYRDFHDFFTSLNNQTTQEAKKWFNERRKIGFLKMTKKFYHRFIKAYFFKQGFKDGFIGFMVAYGGAMYQLMSYAKYKLLLKEEEIKCESRK